MHITPAQWVDLKSRGEMYISYSRLKVPTRARVYLGRWARVAVDRGRVDDECSMTTLALASSSKFQLSDLS